MPITNDEQIDFERVVTDPEYRRNVIVYLNAQARRRTGRAMSSGLRESLGTPTTAPGRAPLRRIG